MRIGFVGLGAMGRGMASNLVRAGYTTAVYDVRGEAVAALDALGARSVKEANEVAEGADLVCVAVFDEKQVRLVLQGADGRPGVLATAPSGAVVAIHTTTSPGFVAEMAEAAAPYGIDVIDAAMTGGSTMAADAGTLTFMVGGLPAALERVRKPFETMARTIFHLGPVGSGMGVKIISNFLSAGNLVLVREAERIAAALGIGEARMLSVVNAGRVGASWVTENWQMIRDQEQNLAPGIAGPAQIVPKDLALAHALAAALEVPAPVLAAMAAQAAPDIRAHGVTVSRDDGSPR
jgi:3-hydroxyisobutyrate dehydrogenase